jgi:hypothetical protein
MSGSSFIANNESKDHGKIAEEEKPQNDKTEKEKEKSGRNSNEKESQVIQQENLLEKNETKEVGEGGVSEGKPESGGQKKIEKESERGEEGGASEGKPESGGQKEIEKESERGEETGESEAQGKKGNKEIIGGDQKLKKKERTTLDVLKDAVNGKRADNKYESTYKRPWYLFRKKSSPNYVQYEEAISLSNERGLTIGQKVQTGKAESISVIVAIGHYSYSNRVRLCLVLTQETDLNVAFLVEIGIPIPIIAAKVKISEDTIPVLTAKATGTKCASFPRMPVPLYNLADASSNNIIAIKTKKRSLPSTGDQSGERETKKKKTMTKKKKHQKNQKITPVKEESEEDEENEETEDNEKNDSTKLLIQIAKQQQTLLEQLLSSKLQTDSPKSTQQQPLTAPSSSALSTSVQQTQQQLEQFLQKPIIPSPTVTPTASQLPLD